MEKKLETHQELELAEWQRAVLKSINKVVSIVDAHFSLKTINFAASKRNFFSLLTKETLIKTSYCKKIIVT